VGFGATAWIDDGDPVPVVQRRGGDAKRLGCVGVRVHDAVGDKFADDQRHVVERDAGRDAAEVRADPSAYASGRLVSSASTTVTSSAGGCVMTSTPLALRSFSREGRAPEPMLVEGSCLAKISREGAMTPHASHSESL
jgi:hypothetical protein